MPYCHPYTDLAGRNNLDAAKADMLIDGVEDVSAHLRPAMREKDPEKKVVP